jgi:hypothetical protein
MRYRTTHDMLVKWGPNHTPLSNYETLVPKGTECEPIPEGTTAQTHYWVRHPMLLIPREHTIQRHDAYYYGISIPKEDVEAWG